MKIAVVTCYKYTDYVRGTVLCSALASLPGVEVCVIKNQATGPWRYMQVFVGMVRARFTKKPDAWLVTFRGYEILPFVRMIAGRKPLIFDEFVNPLEVTTEHRQQRQGTFIGWLMGAWRLAGWLYYLILRRCQAILTDTDVHAAYASKQAGLPVSRYTVVPAGVDEHIFKPRKIKPTGFTVLYYGSMVPLHGLSYVLDAAKQLTDLPVTFHIIGGEKAAKKQIQAAISDGAHITYSPRVALTELGDLVNSASMGLGGPFGDTLQSDMVITGKTYQFLASGVACVVGSGSATKPYFIDGKNSIVVPQADGEALAAAIRNAYKNRDQLTKIGAAGRQTYSEHFSNKRIISIMKKLLTQLELLPAAEHGAKD